MSAIATSTPGIMTRLRAMATGEVSAATLEAYRGAGGAVYDLFVKAEHRRGELVAAGKTAWTMTDSERSFLAATWIAYSFQTLGDAFLQADYDADPGTIGFVPPVTARQAELFYGAVEEWLAAALRAQGDETFVLPRRVPVALPAWVEVEPCPAAHLAAMMAACRTIAEHATIAVADCARAATDDTHKAELAMLQGELASLTSSSDYAQSLYQSSHAPGSALHERMETTIKAAIESAFRLGQLAAMPAAITEDRNRRQNRRSTATIRALPLPGMPGFDLFCLTDPHAAPHFRKDMKAQKALGYLWSRDPAPEATLAIQQEIEAALARGDISYAKDNRSQQGRCYYCCPWGAIYHVDHEVEIDRTRLRPGQEFAFDVSAEPLAEVGPFKRQITVGNFFSTSETDYCDENR
ncbi:MULTISPECIES: hypothetical protein [unclassified Acidiphilium]|uniref:hypothetical protein n=1 Tax=unclassified Acidiphilium TaxID=2617493 RepID=UPI000BC6E0D2|nr:MULTISPECIES: hypothetical protein [unclassified Acidiphilium]MCW8309124.1 hypothetical protein [Acidiphilium sp. PA]OZB27469.1 MAG: hypothetical protein B7X49_10785 [Acidiphilium sp. 34-64-41]